MSFVPAPQKANASGNAAPNALTSAVGKGAPAPKEAAVAVAVAAEEVPDEELIFKLRTYDVFWVDKDSLMYKDGYAKTFIKDTRKAITVIKRKSSIPLILRDMAPPEGSVFDPAKTWAEERERRKALKEDSDANAAKDDSDKKKKAGGGGGGGGKKGGKKGGGISAADIKASNTADKDTKDLQRDLQKLSNLRTLKALQDAKCETSSGKIHRMFKMLHMAVCDLKVGSVGATEAEVLDILWALEEMPAFKNSEELISHEKAQKKEEKEVDKKSSKKKESESKSKKDSKKSKDDKEEKQEKIVLTSDAKTLKELLKEGTDARGTFKDSLKYARKLMSSKKDLISFQLTAMHDRLPPLSRYNRHFSLERWQCEILEAIDERKSAVVAAPTSSGKTLLSTYTCKISSGTVLFVLPSEVLVWQVAATYYEFFKGNVTICTDQIAFQEISGDAQVYIGTPRALEKALTKARGVAGQEMTRGEKEFTILDGGYTQFDYLVLDEVHTLNGPEGDALQRIIKCTTCPCLALSATIGNAEQLKSWFESVRKEHMQTIHSPSSLPKDILLVEHFARFINLQRYVVTESESKDGKKKQKLVKLHPVAAMTPERLKNEPDLIAALSMTPMDMMDLWIKIRSIFPATALEEMDDPDNFFTSQVDASKRITLLQTKEYENHLKKRLTILSQSHSELYERLRISQLPPPLKSEKDVGELVYGVVEQLKDTDLLPCVAFQLDTYRAFHMFKILLECLESEQVREFPDYRKDLIKLAREKAQMRKVAAGKSSRENVAEAEEDAKTGFTDDLLVSEDTTKPHDKYVLTPASKRLSYNEVEDVIADMKKAGEKVDINHALIRGLRRGIAIFTNEVGFTCYRRQVQMLAQKGRLAVVFSDSALAYGVNMPFRSCLFCGDMGESLTPLIAQQMQGRAGRRGMDQQGNVIYLGMEWPYIENLMLGQISKVTGKNPLYPIMALQRALAASNDPEDEAHFIHDDNEYGTGFAMAIRKRERVKPCHPTITDDRIRWMCSTTLEEFCESKLSEPYLATSKYIVQSLGYVNHDMTLAMPHNVLTMVWEMLDFMPEAIHLCALLEQLYIRLCFNKTKIFQQSDSTQNEFLSVLVHVLDRVPARQGEASLQQLLGISPSADKSTPLNEDAISMWLETETALIKQQDIIEQLNVDESDKARMRLALPAGGDENDFGPPLDKELYEMLVSKQKGFREDQSMDRRNELKDRVVRLGQICMIVHNNIQQPHSKYSALEVHFRRMFSNIRYCVADMMNQLSDQADFTEV